MQPYKLGYIFMEGVNITSGYPCFHNVIIIRHTKHMVCTFFSPENTVFQRKTHKIVDIYLYWDRHCFKMIRGWRLQFSFRSFYHWITDCKWISVNHTSDFTRYHAVTEQAQCGAVHCLWCWSVYCWAAVCHLCHVEAVNVHSLGENLAGLW